MVVTRGFGSGDLLASFVIVQSFLWPASILSEQPEE